MVVRSGSMCLTTFLLAAAVSIQPSQRSPYYGGDVFDYCLNESFNVSCDDNKVLLVTSAKFGRMRPGRCISGDFNLGCTKDVKVFLDSQCTARSSCDVSIRSLVDMHPCQRDFVSYLEASFLCVSVVGLMKEACPRDGVLQLFDLEGYLFHYVDNPVGTDRCPWIITVQPGQRLNLTIIPQPSNDLDPIPTGCSCHVIINDLVAVRTTQTNICMDNFRRPQRHLYTSAGNRLKIHVKVDAMSTEFPRFLLHYLAIGCPESPVPRNAWVQRIGEGGGGDGGGNGDSLMVRCNYTFETWYLTCQNNRWHGDLGNCSTQSNIVRLSETEPRNVKPNTFNGTHLKLASHAIDGESAMNARSPAFTWEGGILVAVVIGVVLGVTIGIVLLMFVYFIRRRSDCRQTGSDFLLMTSNKKNSNESGLKSVNPADSSPAGLVMGVETRLQLTDSCACAVKNWQHPTFTSVILPSVDHVKHISPNCAFHQLQLQQRQQQQQQQQGSNSSCDVIRQRPSPVSAAVVYATPLRRQADGFVINRLSTDTVDLLQIKEKDTEVKPEVRSEVKPDVRSEVYPEVRSEVKPETVDNGSFVFDLHSTEVKSPSSKLDIIRESGTDTFALHS